MISICKTGIIYTLLAVLCITAAIPFSCFAAEQAAAENSEQVKAPSKLDDLSKAPPTWQLPGTTGSFWKILYKKVAMSLFIMAILVVFAILASRSFKNPPTRLQNLAEMIMGFFDQLTKDTLGDKSRKLFPLITTLFLYLLLCNWAGILPGFGQFFGYVVGFILAPFTEQISIGGSFLKWSVQIADTHWLAFLNNIPDPSHHFFAEPTADLNTPLACGFISIVVVHWWAIKAKGIKGYLKSYADPIILFAPLNVVGEIAKGISLSFRLFGNILGGSIVILVLTELLLRAPWLFLPVGIVLPIGLICFLGLFVGAIQAFVFAMLALTYTAVAIGD